MSLNMNRRQRRIAERHIAKESSKFGEAFEPIPLNADTPAAPPGMVRAMRNRHFLVQEYRPAPGTEDMVHCRLSVNLIALNGDEWADGIGWDKLQAIKRAFGYAEFEAVEVYPRDRDVVCVANFRHLWILTGLLPFTWRKPL